MEQIVLFGDKSECCGCGACKNICPKSAISMKEDEYGFVYPVIDEKICIGCGQCKKVCGFNNTKCALDLPKAYAGVSVNSETVFKSSSGGIFSEIAGAFLDDGGVVYGCSMENIDGKLKPIHIRVDSEDYLYKLRGSKYVQSDLGNCYIQIKNDLDSGKKVMFSGTPCQVSSLRTFLGNKKYDGLFTIDIVCHGVPSARFFGDYIDCLSKKMGVTIKNFRFRDKSSGWYLQGAIDYEEKNGLMKSKILNPQLSSYFKLFIDSATYRESCYNCKFANGHRVGDITLGDYWGIERAHPEYLTANGGKLDSRKGISCVLINTAAGFCLIDEFGKNLNLLESSFEKVAAGNDQLNHPSSKPDYRNTILSIYKKGNYEAVEKWFDKLLGTEKYKIVLKDGIKRYIKKIIRKI